MRLITVNSGSSGNCYLLQDDNGHYLMLDCGERIRWTEILAACGFAVSNIDAMLCSHIHADHLSKVKTLQMNGIPVYSSDEVQQFVETTTGELIRAMPEKSVQFLPGGWKTVPWYVPHSGNGGERVKCFAYYIESPSRHRAVYITDFMYSPITFKAMKAQTILIACNHDDEIDSEENAEKVRHVVTGHSSLSVVKELLAVNKTDALQNVILCHLSESNATPDIMLSEVQAVVGDSVEVSIAQKGKKINLRKRVSV